MAEGKPLRGKQHRLLGFGLVYRVVCLAGLPVARLFASGSINMSLTRNQKKDQVKELTEQLGKAASVMFAHYIGLTVAEVSELRNTLKENDSEMRVAKKTLLKIAAKEAGIPELDDKTLDGPISCIFSYADPLSGAQIAFKFGKTHKQVDLVGGVFEGKLFGKEEVIELAKMPSRDVLLATFASMIRSPLYSFASICSSPLVGFARAMSELAEKGGVSGEKEQPPVLNKDKGSVAAAPEKVEVEEAPKKAEEPSTEEPKEAEMADASEDQPNEANEPTS